MSIIIPANSAVGGGFEVANSIRFDDGSSSYLQKSASGGNRRTFTFSTWVKRSTLGGGSSGYNTFFSSDEQATNSFRLTFSSDSSDDKLMTYFYTGSQQMQLITNRLFRDVSAWYHIVVAVDTTQGTSSNRTKLYVNGVQETSFSTETYPSQNLDMSVNQSGAPNRVGAGTSLYFDGYMSETVLIDGQQLTPTSFGEFDEDSGAWKAIDVSGLTFGTNGFYLNYENSSELGTDANGGTTLSETNVTAVDQSLDTCTNNACTWNPLKFWNRSGTLQKVSFDNGNLRAIFDDNGYNEYAFASIGVDTGKWFCEMKAEDITATGNTRIGVLNMDYTGTGNPGDQSTSVSYMANGQKRVGGSNSSYGASYTNGDIIGVALDVTNNTVTFYKNGSSQGSISITANTLYTFYSEDYASSGNKEISANFISPAYAISSGNADGNGYGNFEYAVPSGYLSLCTKNLSEALS